MAYTKSPVNKTVYQEKNGSNHSIGAVLALKSIENEKEQFPQNVMI